MSEIKVSVLVPVFGVEKYIEQCARSLFEQTMLDGIEFIFTDDCTTDKSISILTEVLKEYPHRKPQVKIIHHDENYGLAEARVTGLHAAQGEYVIHCDSDDWVEPNMYELLYAEAKKTGADIIGCDYFREVETQSNIIKEDFGISPSKMIGEMLTGKNIEGYLWNRLIRRDFYLAGHFRAEKGITLLEDLAVTIPMHYATTRVGYVAQPLYHYSKNPTSISNTLNTQNIESSLRVLHLLHKYFITAEMHHIYKNKLGHISLSLISHPQLYAPTRWREVTKGIPLKHFGTIKHRIISWLVRNGFDKINFIIINTYRSLRPIP